MKKREKITRPVVFSQLQAETLAAQWDHHHKFDVLSDAVGIQWTLQETIRLEPVEPDTLIWRSILYLQAKVTAKDLVDTQTLSTTADARLLRKMGTGAYLLQLPAISFLAPQEKALQQLVLEKKIALKASLAGETLHEKKRALLEHMIHARCGFSPPSLSSSFL